MRATKRDIKAGATIYRQNGRCYAKPPKEGQYEILELIYPMGDEMQFIEELHSYDEERDRVYGERTWWGKRNGVERRLIVNYYIGLWRNVYIPQDIIDIPSSKRVIKDYYRDKFIYDSNREEE